MKLPHRKSTILSVLALVTTLGGYGGYTVVRNQPHYNPLYDYQVHTVARVIDGDTIVLEDDTRVRLLGIDAPEAGECYGIESTNTLRTLIENKQVRLEKDLTAQDDFGRYLRYVYLDNPDPREDNTLVNQYLVEQGYATDDTATVDKRYRIFLAQAREQAKANNRGLWGACEVPITSTETLTDSGLQPSDPTCLIKANISKEGAGKTYFLPSCGNYGRVKIDPSIGEAYFCTRTQAENAGFTLSASCANNGVE